MLGSLFSMHESTAEPFQAVEQIVASAQPESLATPVQTQTPAAWSEGSRPISEARSSFTPLVTEVPQGMGPTLKTGGAGGPRKERIESTEPGVEWPDQQVFSQGPYRPLLTDNLRRTGAKIFRDSSPFTSDAREIEKVDLPRRVAQPDREADEIQIHIGRIEVTAVPPAPARPAAQPARKSLRLDEYLSGRGRAG
jgi:hypothetical protein